MKKPMIDEKGEGMIKLILVAAILIGGGYFALQYFGIIGDKPAPAATTAQAAPTPAAAAGNGSGGSMAAQQVQGAQALGELSGGR